MKLTVSSIAHLWITFCFQAIADSHPTVAGPLSLQRKSSPPLPPSAVTGAWGRCSSKYGLEPADTAGAVECASTIGVSRGETITISVNDKPQLLCDDYGAKIWIAPFTNKPNITTDSFTFETSEVRDIVLLGAQRCCDSSVSPTCSGWGILSEVPGRQDVLVSINHSNRPEPLSYNDVSHYGL